MVPSRFDVCCSSPEVYHPSKFRFGVAGLCDGLRLRAWFRARKLECVLGALEHRELKSASIDVP